MVSAHPLGPKRVHLVILIQVKMPITMSWNTSYSSMRHVSATRGTVWAQPACEHVSSLGDIDAHFAWQAWHLRHWAGSGDAPGSQMTPWPPRLFAWQAWHLVTSTVTLRGRRGTWRHGPSPCVAGVALGDMYLHLVTSTLTLRGRRGTYGTGPALVTRRVPK